MHFAGGFVVVASVQRWKGQGVAGCALETVSVAGPAQVREQCGIMGYLCPALRHRLVPGQMAGAGPLSTTCQLSAWPPYL